MKSKASTFLYNKIVIRVVHINASKMLITTRQTHLWGKWLLQCKSRNRYVLVQMWMSFQLERELLFAFPWTAPKRNIKITNCSSCYSLLLLLAAALGWLSIQNSKDKQPPAQSLAEPKFAVHSRIGVVLRPFIIAVI